MREIGTYPRLPQEVDVPSRAQRGNQVRGAHSRSGGRPLRPHWRNKQQILPAQARETARHDFHMIEATIAERIICVTLTRPLPCGACCGCQVQLPRSARSMAGWSAKPFWWTKQIKPPQEC